MLMHNRRSSIDEELKSYSIATQKIAGQENDHLLANRDGKALLEQPLAAIESPYKAFLMTKSDRYMPQRVKLIDKYQLCLQT